MISAFPRAMALLALAALGTVGGVQAAEEIRTTQLAMEVPVSKITLPITETSPAVMPKCGNCPPASFPTTKDTTYHEGRRQITLADLKALVLQYPKLMLTVSYVVKTGELVSITADIPGAAR